MSRALRGRETLYHTVGDVPRLATLADTDPLSQDGSVSQIRHGPGGRAARGRAGLNLAAVGEVLARYGLDPAERLGEILTRRTTVVDREGNVVIDAETGKPLTRPALDPDTEAKLLTELLQYTRPKLKAIEVTVKEPELTDEQIERRLKALMAREAKGKL